MHLNNIAEIEIKNITIKNKWYCIDEDDPRYDYNNNLKPVQNKNFS